MAGKESRSKGRGRGLRGGTGFSGDDGGGVRGDEHKGSARTDVGVGVTESLRRFGGRTSRSGPRRIRSAAISEEQRMKARRERSHDAIDFGSSRAASANHAPPSATKAEGALGKRLPVPQRGSPISG